MISVIIPVYNAEPYLAHCLDAVLGSAHPDFELLLINDGSTDRSLAICREYARRDSRVRLFSQENQGVSAARNRGLEECAGEWIVFVDADDVISPAFLGLIAAEEYAAQDMLLFDFAGTEFMDSSGIGVLIGRCRNMSYCGGSVKAQHMNERIQKIFRISGLHQLMETEEQANG